MRALCVQPPFVQLNAPYPAIWYLDAYLRSKHIDSTPLDLSIELARIIFSREGLSRVFDAARPILAVKKHPDAATDRRVRSYLDQEGLYLGTIDSITGFLSGEDPAFAYRLAVGEGIPQGMRTEAVLGDAGGITPDDARALATAIINDLSDFISYALDPAFGAVRYAERIAHGAESFGPLLRAARSGWVFREFYRPLLKRTFASLPDSERVFVCLSVPFPGCLSGAIVAAEEARAAYGDRATILLGGGYVSTELRFLDDASVFDVFDYLCYDAGYGSLDSILDRLGGDTAGRDQAAMRLYRTRYRAEDGSIVAEGFPEDEPACRVGTELPVTEPRVGTELPATEPRVGTELPSTEPRMGTELPVTEPRVGTVLPSTEPRMGTELPVTEPRVGTELASTKLGVGTELPIRPPKKPTLADERERAEREAIAKVHPDYRGAPLSRYLRIVDSPNPMHRLWNDTPWLKYRLAYGCYWKRCAFCDTQLDYIKRYIASDLDALVQAADAAASASGLYGIHFTDEAMPVGLVRGFATRNETRPRPFTFWGNVRFDKAWTEEACRYAAARGLVAVSGGIEIATGRGLEMVDKGFTLHDLFRSLLAFKKSGVLVHAYLVYGFPGQSGQEIADSAETVRALFAHGLIDSAFWHKFVLTRHSRLYARWELGEVPGLVPRAARSSFSVNDLSFDGEEAYDRWTAPLDAALSAWSDRGETDLGLSAFLPKGLPRPRIDAEGELRAVIDR